MLAEKDEHGLIEHMHIAEGGLLGGFAFEVYDVLRQIPVLPATHQHTVGQVDVLAIHKEILIEQPHLVERLAAKQAEGTADDFYTSRLIPRQVAHIVTLAETQHLAERYPGRGDGTARLGGQRTVGIMHANACPTRPRMGIHETDHCLQRGLCHDGVGIQQQHILTLRLPDGDIVSLRKTEVLLIRNQMHPGIVVVQNLDGIVGRVVVHHEDLRLEAFRGSLHAFETLLHEAAYIIADDNDRQFHHYSLLMFHIEPAHARQFKQA